MKIEKIISILGGLCCLLMGAILLSLGEAVGGIFFITLGLAFFWLATR